MASPSHAAAEGQDLVAEWALRESIAQSVWYVVPSPSGQRLFRQHGWVGFRAAIASWAASRAVDLERMQVVASIPATTPGTVGRPIDPEILRVVPRGGTGVDVTLHVPYELAIFRGHFSSVPIVPGAMLVGWVGALAARHAGWQHGVRRSSAMKFRRIVQPGPEYIVRLDRSTDGSCLHFTVESPSGTHSSGSLLAPQS